MTESLDIDQEKALAGLQGLPTLSRPMFDLLFLDYGIRRWRELKQPGNEEQTAHLQTGLLHGLCDPRCEPLGGTPFAERDNVEALPCLPSSFSTNGLTCLLHLHFTSCRNTPIYLAIHVGETGMALTCRGSKPHSLVIMAHRTRAFLLAIATVLRGLRQRGAPWRRNMATPDKPDGLHFEESPEVKTPEMKSTRIMPVRPIGSEFPACSIINALLRHDYHQPICKTANPRCR